MKPLYKTLITIILTILGVVVIMRSCGHQTSAGQNIDVKALHKSIVKTAQEIKARERKAAISQTIAVAGRDRWHEAKDRIVRKDSLIRRDSVIYLVKECDTVLGKDSTAMADKDSVIASCKVYVALKDQIHTQDSTEIRKLKREVRRQKFQKWLVIGLWGIKEGLAFKR